MSSENSQQEEEETTRKEGRQMLRTKRSSNGRTGEETSNTCSGPSEIIRALKEYLDDRIDEEEKNSETKASINKEAAKLRSKGNQKQFEFNAEIERLLIKLKEKHEGPREVSKEKSVRSRKRPCR